MPVPSVLSTLDRAPSPDVEPTSSALGYEPRAYWNEKARASSGDVLAAVCHDDEFDNRNIDAVQKRLVTRALARAEEHAALSGRKVLDYGCGTGRWADVLRGLGGMYCGVDIADEMIALAESHDPSGEYRVLEKGRIPYPDEAFDLVCSIAVLHHNPYGEQEQILAEMLRVLRPDGQLVLFESVGAPDPSSTIEFARPSEEWRKLVRAYGLDRIWYEGGRYFLVRSAVARVLGRRSRHRAVERLGSTLDPLLGPLLPVRLQTRAAMVFRRAPDDTLAAEPG